MSLAPLYHALADTLNGPNEIEHAAAKMLRHHADEARLRGDPVPLSHPFLEILQEPASLPVCNIIADIPFRWVPPETSSDPKYQALGASKVHVELIGPDGLARSDDMRIGLYGIRPNSEYGIRTHPAEEVFVMLAGRAFWIRGDAPYQLHHPGERSYHPSMLPHATRTGNEAFLSIYVWRGDISTENYVFVGAPDERS